MASWQLWIVRVIGHLLGKYLFVSLLQLIFFLLLSIPLSPFSWFCLWSLWLRLIFCTLIVNIIIIYSLEFSHQRKLMVFHWRLSDSKSPQVSRTLLSILAVFNNAVVWMVSTRSPTSKSSRPFNNLLVTVTKAPITIGIIVTFMFQSFFNSLVRSRYLSLFSHSFSFILWSAGTVKSTILQILFFCCCCCWLL